MQFLWFHCDLTLTFPVNFKILHGIYLENSKVQKVDT